MPDRRHAKVMAEGISWNYTTWLNIVALLLSAGLLVRFCRTGGREMLSMMGGSPDDMAHANHSAHDHTVLKRAAHPASRHTE